MSDEPLDSPLVSPMPEGWHPLSVDDAVSIMLTGDHPESDQGFIGMDVGLVDLMRCGAIKPATDLDGNLAFGVTEHGGLIFHTMLALGCKTRDVDDL